MPAKTVPGGEPVVPAGRFISPDPAVPDLSNATNPGNYDPRMLNHYVYCRNNPLIHIDPSGLEDDDIGGIPSGDPDGTDEDRTMSELGNSQNNRPHDAFGILFGGHPEPSHRSKIADAVWSLIEYASKNGYSSLTLDAQIPGSFGIFSEPTFNSDKIAGAFGAGYASGFGLSMTGGLYLIESSDDEGLFCGMSASGAFNNAIGRGHRFAAHLDLKSYSMGLNMGVGFDIGDGFRATFECRGAMERW